MIPRHPKVIVGELRELDEQASKWAIPKNLAKATDLSLEFAESVCAVLDAAGILPPVPTDTPTA